MKDLRQTSEYASFMKQNGWVVETIKTDSKRNIYAYIKKIPFLPLHVMKIQRFYDIPNFDKISRLCRKYKVISITFEPGLLTTSKIEKIENLFKDNKYKKKGIPFVPSKTIQIDLKYSKSQLFNQMKWVARANIKKANTKCLTKSLNWNDNKIEKFYSFFKYNGKGYIPSLNEFKKLLSSFKKNCFIVTCLYKNEFCSGIVILTTPEIAYYYYAVISEIGKKCFAGELAVNQALLEAKKRGCRIFDFEGIYDERYPQLKKWKGFSQFKNKFGGEEITYPRAFEK